MDSFEIIGPVLVSNHQRISSSWFHNCFRLYFFSRALTDTFPFSTSVFRYTLLDAMETGFTLWIMNLTEHLFRQFDRNIGSGIWGSSSLFDIYFFIFFIYSFLRPPYFHLHCSGLNRCPLFIATTETSFQIVSFLFKQFFKSLHFFL